MADAGPMAFNMRDKPLFKLGTNKIGPIVHQLTISPHGGLQGAARYVVVTLGMICPPRCASGTRQMDVVPKLVPLFWIADIEHRIS